MGDPSRRQFINVNRRVRQQPIHLLDGMLGVFSARQRQPMADRVYRQGGAADNPQRRVSQRINPLGVNVVAK